MENNVEMQPQLTKKNKIKLKDFLIKGGFDTTFFFLVIALLTIGLLMLFSSSYAYAFHYDEGSSFLYIRNQLKFAGFGLIAMLILSKIDYRILIPLAPWVFGGTIVLLLAVFAMPAYDGQWQRWIYIGGFSFQPSEIAKFTLVVFLAFLIEILGKKIEKIGWFALLLLIVGATAFLIFREPHLSGALIVGAIGVVTILVGGVKTKWLLILVSIALAGLLIYAFLFDGISYAGDRWTAWVDKSFEPTGKRWQVNQSLYAIGSGGLFGTGIGGSKQKHLYVSEPQNDFIFSIVCEELGFVGAVAIILLFMTLVWRGCVIAMRSRDRFGRLLAIGIAAQIGIQTALNILVVTDSIPNTGVSLPFFSSGGTSLFMILAQMGVMLSISRGQKVEDLKDIVNDKVKRPALKKILLFWS